VRNAENLPPSCAVVMKSGNLNFVEASGSVTGLLYLYHHILHTSRIRDNIRNVHCKKNLVLGRHIAVIT